MGGIRSASRISPVRVFSCCHPQKQGFRPFNAKAVAQGNGTLCQVNQGNCLFSSHRQHHLAVCLKITVKACETAVAVRAVAVSGHRRHKHRRRSPLQGSVYVILKPVPKIRGGYITVGPAVGGIIVAPLHKEIIPRLNILQKVIQLSLLHKGLGGASPNGPVLHNHILGLIDLGLTVITVRTFPLRYLTAKK